MVKRKACALSDGPKRVDERAVYLGRLLGVSGKGEVSEACKARVRSAELGGLEPLFWGADRYGFGAKREVTAWFEATEVFGDVIHVHIKDGAAV